MVRVTELLVNSREYEAIQNAINDSITDDPRFPSMSPVQRAKKPPVKENPNLAAFRAATRVYIGTRGGLKVLQTLLAAVTTRQPGAKPRKNLIASPHRFALSISTLLFFHRVLYRLITIIRLQLMHEKVKTIRSRWPRIFDLLTWKLAPAVGASLSGLALGICPNDQLRITIAIYVFVRAAELLFQGAETAGYLKNRPKWMGSWILFALSQGQLFHAFVFDPDCTPESYSSLMIKNTPEYIQKRPEGLSDKVVWPSDRQVVDGIADMARLRWPLYVSPILRPNDVTTLPAGVNPAISSITSRAHPALQSLSCALLHPSETSCFTPVLRQILLSFNSFARGFTLYYSAFSLLRFRDLTKQPIPFLSDLMARIIKVTTVFCLSIAGSWGSICFFNNFLPKSLFPKFRIFLGGAVSGSIAIIDRSATAHENNMYAVRNSLSTLWKVGVKRRWWKSIKGGDVYIFVAALATLNMLYDGMRETEVGRAGTMMAIKLLRGDIEVGLKTKQQDKDT
ncbi:hypothetical protein H2198_000217 [Neophaeococcomyces mojaviensis]|uniref:Uncharacterized protein n=1 Tax=Neophaeococcomyces mojaviensis TaxID=3383035 RepID=A0ACC3AL59_9EURO|nr:hypothetical protein H2198_000217 [Knufia sp. JES_112]